jgi:peroxiredoxin Q/BCP
MKILLAFAIVTMFAAVFSGVARGELKAGDPAPDFELTGSDGKTYNLSSFKDKQAVIIAWYPKAFTGG